MSETTIRRSCSANVAEALDAVQSVGERVFEALASRVSSVPGSVVPRLGSAFWSMSTPVMLILDDVHLLRNAESRDALSVLADHVPQGSTNRRCGSRGYAPNAGSSRSAPVTCR